MSPRMYSLHLYLKQRYLHVFLTFWLATFSNADGIEILFLILLEGKTQKDTLRKSMKIGGLPVHLQVVQEWKPSQNSAGTTFRRAMQTLFELFCSRLWLSLTKLESFIQCGLCVHWTINLDSVWFHDASDETLSPSVLSFHWKIELILATDFFRERNVFASCRPVLKGEAKMRWQTREKNALLLVDTYLSMPLVNFVPK